MRPSFVRAPRLLFLVTAALGLLAALFVASSPCVSRADTTPAPAETAEVLQRRAEAAVRTLKLGDRP